VSAPITLFSLIWTSIHWPRRRAQHTDHAPSLPFCRCHLCHAHRFGIGRSRPLVFTGPDNILQKAELFGHGRGLSPAAYQQRKAMRACASRHSVSRRALRSQSCLFMVSSCVVLQTRSDRVGANRTRCRVESGESRPPIATCQRSHRGQISTGSLLSPESYFPFDPTLRAARRHSLALLHLHGST